MKEFKSGDTVYSDYGQEAEYVAKISEGHIVRPIVEACSGDGEESYWHTCEPITWRHVFETVPTAKYEEKLSVLHEKIAQAESTLSSIKTEIKRAESDNGALLARLKKFDQLRYIEDFLDGKITHYAFVGGYRAEIIPIENAMCSVDRFRPRLLALYGDVKNRGVEWLLHQYSDSSGGMPSEGQWFPARSKEEAEEILRNHIAGQLKRGDAQQRSSFNFFVKEAVKLGLPVSEAHLKKVEQDDESNRQERIKNATRELERVKENLKSLGVEVPA